MEKARLVGGGTVVTSRRPWLTFLVQCPHARLGPCGPLGAVACMPFDVPLWWVSLLMGNGEVLDVPQGG